LNVISYEDNQTGKDLFATVPTYWKLGIGGRKKFEHLWRRRKIPHHVSVP